MTKKKVVKAKIELTEILVVKDLVNYDSQEDEGDGTPYSGRRDSWSTYSITGWLLPVNKGKFWDYEACYVLSMDVPIYCVYYTYNQSDSFSSDSGKVTIVNCFNDIAKARVLADKIKTGKFDKARGDYGQAIISYADDADNIHTLHASWDGWGYHLTDVTVEEIQQINGGRLKEIY